MANQNQDDEDALLQQLGPDENPPRPTAPTSTTIPVPQLGPDENPPRPTAPTSTTIPVPPTDPRDPRFTSANAPRVVQNAQGGWDLTEHGNTRANLQGREVDDAKAYADQFWKDNPTGWQENNPLTMGDIYQQQLGRAPDAAGLAAHARNPGGFAGAVSTIVNSPEANANPNRARPVTSIMGGTTGTGTGATTTRPTAPFQGFQPRHAMEGFDFNREQNIQKSAKDAFAYFANQAPPPPINDKQALAQWFTQYIQPGMNELGHHVNSVNGDSFNFSNWQGSFDVDYGRGAGAPGGALAWQVQEPTARPSNGAYTPGGVTTTTAPPATSAATTTPTTPATNPYLNPNLSSPNAQASLQHQIDALIAGGADPAEVDALKAYLS